MPKVIENILWGRWEASNQQEHPAHITLRKQAREEGYTGVAGFREFAKEKLNARLYVGKYNDITGIGFYNSNSATMFALSIENDNISRS
jgi:hypothetical protein